MKYINEINRIREIMKVPLITETVSGSIADGIRLFLKNFETKTGSNAEEIVSNNNLKKRLALGVDSLGEKELLQIAKNIDTKVLFRELLNANIIKPEYKIKWFENALNELRSNRKSFATFQVEADNLKIISKLYQSMAKATGGRAENVVVPNFIKETEKLYNRNLFNNFVDYFETHDPELYKMKKTQVDYALIQAAKSTIGEITEKDFETLRRTWSYFFQFWQDDQKKFVNAVDNALLALSKGENPEYYQKLAADIVSSRKMWSSNLVENIYYGDPKKGIEGFRSLLTEDQRKVLERTGNPFQLMLEDSRLERKIWDPIKVEMEAFRKIIPFKYINGSNEMFQPGFFSRLARTIVYGDPRSMKELNEALKRRGVKGEILARVVSYALFHKFVIPIVIGAMQTFNGMMLRWTEYGEWAYEHGFIDYKPDALKKGGEVFADNLWKNIKEIILSGQYNIALDLTYLDELWNYSKTFLSYFGNPTKENIEKAKQELNHKKNQLDSLVTPLKDSIKPNIPYNPNVSLMSNLDSLQSLFIKPDSASKDNTNVNAPKLDTVGNWKW